MTWKEKLLRTEIQLLSDKMRRVADSFDRVRPGDRISEKRSAWLRQTAEIIEPWVDEIEPKIEPERVH